MGIAPGGEPDRGHSTCQSVSLLVPRKRLAFSPRLRMTACTNPCRGGSSLPFGLTTSRRRSWPACGASGSRTTPHFSTSRAELREHAPRRSDQGDQSTPRQGGAEPVPVAWAADARQRSAALEALPPDAPRIVLATDRLVGEGFDHPPLDTLLLAMPVSWKGTLQQYAGRLHRNQSGKTSVRIIDWLDLGHPITQRMWKRRLLGYRAMGCALLADHLSMAGALSKPSHRPSHIQA